mmetsp:Transcript_41208/g.93169  ORF Transcript_41208/g.93169 Transcript_41208/m.93169 type:complete len:500 (+) Transcript_41208:18-1517(+)
MSDQIHVVAARPGAVDLRLPFEVVSLGDCQVDLSPEALVVTGPTRASVRLDTFKVDPETASCKFSKKKQLLTVSWCPPTIDASTAGISRAGGAGSEAAAAGQAPESPPGRVAAANPSPCSGLDAGNIGSTSTGRAAPAGETGHARDAPATKQVAPSVVAAAGQARVAPATKQVAPSVVARKLQDAEFVPARGTSVPTPLEQPLAPQKKNVDYSKWANLDLSDDEDAPPKPKMQSPDPLPKKDTSELPPTAGEPGVKALRRHNVMREMRGEEPLPTTSVYGEWATKAVLYGPVDVGRGLWCKTNQETTFEKMADKFSAAQHEEKGPALSTPDVVTAVCGSGARRVDVSPWTGNALAEELCHSCSTNRTTYEATSRLPRVDAIVSHVTLNGSGVVAEVEQGEGVFGYRYDNTVIHYTVNVAPGPGQPEQRFDGITKVDLCSGGTATLPEMCKTMWAEGQDPPKKEWQREINAVRGRLEKSLQYFVKVFERRFGMRMLGRED